MNISYLLYQAERTRSAAEQREIDAQAGELAAAVAGLGGARPRGSRARGIRGRGTRGSSERASPVRRRPSRAASPAPDDPDGISGPVTTWRGHRAAGPPGPPGPR